MLRVAIVGCGKIADAHAAEIQRIKGCEIVGVSDSEPLMAQQLYERFPVKAYFSDLTELLEKAEPHVVHITTPPESHYPIAKLCLESGCHVYVEKPFTLVEREAQELIALAQKTDRKITVGHDGQFRHAMRRMRALVQTGFLGGRPVHLESYYCYQFGDSGYAAALLGDKQHWVRRLPGKLLHNVISHGIARIAEFLTSVSPKVIAYGFASPLLKRMGEKDIVDELRVIISEDEHTTAYFTFSSQMRPSVEQFRVYGPQNGLMVDLDQETLIKLRGKKFTSYAEKFVPPVILAKQYIGNLTRNVGAFLARDFHMTSAKKYLIESFYRSIVEGSAVPIPYREILLTARLMEAIFLQLGDKHLAAPAQPALELETRLTTT